MKILHDICAVLRTKEPALLATIIAASGSTPAPTDSKMLVLLNAPGTGGHSDPSVMPRRTSGTIGGGCLDASIIDVAETAPAIFPAKVFTFHLTDDIGDTGLNCGGTVDVLVEPLNPNSLRTHEAALSLLEGGESCICVTGLTPDSFPLKTVYRADGEFVSGEVLPAALNTLLQDLIVAIVISGV